MEEIDGPRMAFRRIDCSDIGGESFVFPVEGFDDDKARSVTVKFADLSEQEKKEQARDVIVDAAMEDTGQFEADTMIEIDGQMYEIDSTYFGYEATNDEKTGFVSIYPEAIRAV